MKIKAPSRPGAKAAVAFALGAALLAPAAPALADTTTPTPDTVAPEASEAPVPVETPIPEPETTDPAPEKSSSLSDFVTMFFVNPGFGYGTLDESVGWQGLWTANDGSLVACIEPGVWNPLGESTDAGLADGPTSVTPYGSRQLTLDDGAKITATMAKMEQLRSENRLSNRTASAASFVVKAIANPEAMYQSHSYTGPHNLRSYINWVLYSQVGGAETAAIADEAEQMLAEVAGVTAGPIGGTGTVNFAVDPTNNYKGTVSVVVPGNTVDKATITLTNGVFELTGTNTLAGANLGQSYAVRGVAPESGADYKISGSAVINSGYAGNVHLWLTGDRQKTVGPGTQASFTATGEDPGFRSPDFQPEAISAAPRFAKPGDPLTDTATFRLAADENGRVNEWKTNSRGEFAPTDWTVEAYAVDEAPEEATSEVPEGAELIATTTFNTGIEGPNAKGVATFAEGEVMPEDGRAVIYRWIFDAAAQPERIQTVFPEGYLWTDLFGLYEETTFGFDITTKAQPGTKKGDTSFDVAIVTGVLPKEGLEITFEKYLVPTVKDSTGKWVPDVPEGTEPGDDSWVCVPENLIGDTNDEPIHITEAGEYKSTGLVAPEHGEEFWLEKAYTIATDDRERELAAEGECGDPFERTHVINVKTQAHSDSGAGTAQHGDKLWDVAEILGSVPEGATSIFRLYQVKEGEKLVCTEETLIWTSKPIALEAGLYKDTPQEASSGVVPSDVVVKPYATTTTFVEESLTEDGGQLSEGECGEPSETLKIPGAPAGGNLAQTGGALNPIGAIAGGTLIAGGLAAFLLPILLRRRAKKVDA